MKCDMMGQQTKETTHRKIFNFASVSCTVPREVFKKTHVANNLKGCAARVCAKCRRCAQLRNCGQGEGNVLVSRSIYAWVWGGGYRSLVGQPPLPIPDRDTQLSTGEFARRRAVHHTMSTDGSECPLFFKFCSTMALGVMLSVLAAVAAVEECGRCSSGKGCAGNTCIEDPSLPINSMNIGGCECNLQTAIDSKLWCPRSSCLACGCIERFLYPGGCVCVGGTSPLSIRLVSEHSVSGRCPAPF